MNGLLVSAIKREDGLYPAVLGFGCGITHEVVSAEFWHVQGELAAGEQDFLFYESAERDPRPVRILWPGLPVNMVEKIQKADGSRSELRRVGVTE